MSRPWVVVAFVIFAQRQFAVMLVVIRMVGAAAVEKQYHKAGVQQYAGCIEHGADVYDQFVSRCILYASSDRGALMMLTVIELGKRWAWPSFVVSAVLSFLVVADKEAVAIFVLFLDIIPF